MEQENAVLVQWSFRELLSGGDRAVEALLERLYARAPGLMHCFAPAGPFQRRRQMAALAFALKSLEDFDLLRPALRALARRLREAGMTDFATLKAAALAALREEYGSSWTANLSNAWDDVLETVAETMRTGAEGSRAAA